MSQNFEESPVSDNKMDISEATTSQESAGVSPSVENVPMEDEKLNCASIAINNIISLNTTTTSTITEATKNNFIKTTMNNDNFDENISKLDNLKLDNDPPNVLRLGRQQNYCNRSELQLANSHPLMSPPGTDSDSENSHIGHNHKVYQKESNRIFNFPDVIPETEQPLRLGNVCNNRLNNEDNTKSTIITGNYQKNPIQSHLNLNTESPVVTNIDNTTATTINNQNQKSKIFDHHHHHHHHHRRDPSPDLLSSESDQEISQYQANVEPNYQAVTLMSNNLNRLSKTTSPLRPLTRRKIPLTSEILSDDMSSLDSISNHSFGDDDDDMDHNLASLSPSSSVLDGFNDKIDDFLDIETPTNIPSDPIPLYSAAEERRDSRNWQKITLPDGRVREIDMRVIEPYKRVLSHGGYLKAGGHNAIVMFCACHLPDRSRADYHYVMDNLFLYVVKTLEQLVTDDYVLVYLHGGSSRRNVPPFPWLKKCYQLLDRRLRKSLKNLYLVHPSFWLKSVVWMSRPFVSSKFWRKLVYVRSLEELYTLVSVEKAAIPEKVKQYDAKYT